MTTLTVEIDKERDLPILQALLTRMGLKFQVEEDEWNGLSEAEIEGIKAGLEDLAAGRVFTHEQVRAHMKDKLNHLRSASK